MYKVSSYFINQVCNKISELSKIRYSAAQTSAITFPEVDRIKEKCGSFAWSVAVYVRVHVGSPGV